MIPPPARVFGFVAAEADVCVLLRRGPAKRVLMVRWDLATDEFEIGQWLFARVYEDLCDLSPNGKLFAYAALRYGRPHPESDRFERTYESYTAISRPPYFTAIGLWEEMGRWGGGAYWKSDSELQLATGGDRLTLGRAPETLSFSSGGYFTIQKWEESFWHLREARARLRYREGELQRWKVNVSWKGEKIKAEWADVDHRGRLLFARKGRVFVRDEQGEREMIDLNPLEFRPLPPPEWAMEWP